MVNLTKEQRELRNKIEGLKDGIKEAELEIKEYQKVCNHNFILYEEGELKYCMICGFEDYI